jgi:hypothetical protein
MRNFIMPRRVALALALAVFVQVVGAAPTPKEDEKAVLYQATTVGDKLECDVLVNGKTKVVTSWVTAVEQ